MDNYQFAKAVEDKKHVDVEGDGEGDVLLLLKEEEQEKQKDGGESLAMPADVASMKRKRGDEDDQDVGGDDDETEAEDKHDEAEAEDYEDDESGVDDDAAKVHYEPSEEGDENVEKYYEQLKSEGFDLDDFPFVPYLGLPLESVVRVHIEYQVNRDVVTPLAEAALTHYNNEHNTSYLIDSLEEANVSASGELFVYGITFKVKNMTSDGKAVAPETLQAEVEKDFGADGVDDDHLSLVTVNFCRSQKDLK